jgi:hypothetical protein
METWLRWGSNASAASYLCYCFTAAGNLGRVDVICGGRGECGAAGGVKRWRDRLGTWRGRTTNKNARAITAEAWIRAWPPLWLAPLPRPMHEPLAQASLRSHAACGRVRRFARLDVTRMLRGVILAGAATPAEVRGSKRTTIRLCRPSSDVTAIFRRPRPTLRPALRPARRPALHRKSQNAADQGWMAGWPPPGPRPVTTRGAGDNGEWRVAHIPGVVHSGAMRSRRAACAPRSRAENRCELCGRTHGDVDAFQRRPAFQPGDCVAGECRIQRSVDPKNGIGSGVGRDPRLPSAYLHASSSGRPLLVCPRGASACSFSPRTPPTPDVPRPCEPEPPQRGRRPQVIKQ